MDNETGMVFAIYTLERLIIMCVLRTGKIKNPRHSTHAYTVNHAAKI